MPKTLPKVRSLWLILIISSFLAMRGQDASDSGARELVPLIQLLEERYEVKFSYADEDLEGILVYLDASGPLEQILEELRQQTQLLIRQLNNRYYTISKSTTVDICATVLDNFENNSIPGATVEVMGSSIAVTTASDGSFSLKEIPRKATLKIRYLGYKTLYITADRLLRNNPCTTLMLSVLYQQLDEVIVYKYLTSGLSKQSDGSILMKPGDFGLLPGLTEPDVLQTIQALPGIKSIDETVSNINIRGGTNDQNLLLWDGIQMYQSGHFFGLISAFNPYLTEEVSIIKNGSSARYGGGLSGIIRMQTYDEVQRNYYGGAGINLIGGDLYAHIPLSDRLAFQFSARRSVTDFLNTPTYSEFFDRAFQDTEISGPGSVNTDRIASRDENFYFYDFSGKVLYDLGDRHKLRLNFQSVTNDLTYSEILSADDSENRSNLDQTNLSFGARLSSNWSQDLSTRILIYHTEYELDSDVFSESSGQALFQLNQVNENALKTELSYRFNNQLRWLAGYQFFETGITNTTRVNLPFFESSIKNLLYTHAAFTEWQYNGPGKKLLGTAGLRLNYLQNPGNFDEVYLEPRLSLGYAISDAFRLEVLGELKNQATHQIIDLEQNFLGIEKRRWVLADGSSLPVAKSKQVSAGLHFDKGHWLAGLEVFYKEVDGISTDTQGFQNENQFSGEIGRYRVNGIEALLNYKSEQWSNWISYAFNQNNYTFEALQPATFPNNLDIRHTLTLGSNYTYDNFKIAVGLNYRTGKPFTEPQPAPNDINSTAVPARINFQPPNSSRLPDYLRMDASLVYSFRLSEGIQANAGASVLNLSGRKNILDTYFRLNDQDEIERVENISLGLTPNLSFRIRF
ncbi:TonB-dependent receptor [Robiginitalea sp. IMCC44478]|uniref:TonB-dependent receptor n=1 Tax=Robiginitalea sp. IMCC44478 TaxID=3459122 RepID=UPI0040423D30